MGEIIQLNHKNDNNDEAVAIEKKKLFIKEKIGVLFWVLTTFCTITGVTVVKFVERDWQEIAEQYNNNGLELYNLGEYEEAIVLYDKAIDLEDKDIRDIEVCYYNRGRAYFKLGNYQKAIGDYSIAIEISPQSKYYKDRAVAYEMIGETEKAALDNISALTSIVK
ncbi:MAG: tetratricopeptide repeat protein [bacterium]|nr:tetratricopeptide repeat protein [bacterium]